MLYKPSKLSIMASDAACMMLCCSKSLFKPGINGKFAQEKKWKTPHLASAEGGIMSGTAASWLTGSFSTLGRGVFSGGKDGGSGF